MAMQNQPKIYIQAESPSGFVRLPQNNENAIIFSEITIWLPNFLKIIY